MNNLILDMIDQPDSEPEKPEKKERPFYEPGWYRDLSNEEYHGSFGYSSTTIKKLIKRTPAHLLHSFGEEEDSVVSKEVGSAVHILVLEPDQFEKEVVLMPEINRRTKDGREDYKNFMETNAGKVILTEEQHLVAKEMAANVLKHPRAGLLLQDTINESSVYQWYHSLDEDDQTEYREMVKVRPDAASKAYSCLIDLKSTKDGSYTGFQREILNFAYHVSGAMYLEVCNNCDPLLDACGHLAFTRFIWICVENFPPYEVSVYEMSPEFRDLGKTIFRRCMQELHHGKENNWPGYPEEVRIMEPPTWASRAYIV